MSTQTPQEQGKAAADRDQTFNAETALQLGAKPENVERITGAIEYDKETATEFAKKNNFGEEQTRRYIEKQNDTVTGYLYLIENDGPAVFAYCQQLHKIHTQKIYDEMNWFLNHPSA